MPEVSAGRKGRPAGWAGGLCGLREGAPFLSRAEGRGRRGGAGKREAGLAIWSPAFVKHNGRGPGRSRGWSPACGAAGGRVPGSGGADACSFLPA